MQARDVMIKPVLTVKPETTIAEIAGLLLEKHISGVPVVDSTGSLVGMVTEGDLLKLNAPTEDKRKEWWLCLLAEGENLSKEFLSTIGDKKRTARDIMSAPVVTVSEDTDVAEIGKLFTSMRIKRVPVLRDGRITGIVARADLVRVVANLEAQKPQEAGIFGWTLRFDPFASEAKAPAKPAGQTSVSEEKGLSASNFRHLVEGAFAKKAQEVEHQHHVEEEQHKTRLKELIDHHLSDNHWHDVLNRARIAAEQGEREVILLQFPHDLCSDGGRAINVGEPNWPSTLRGEAAETYLRFERDLKPRGFHIIAKVLGFPGGYIGDIGLFLHWGGVEQS